LPLTEKKKGRRGRPLGRKTGEKKRASKSQTTTKTQGGRKESPQDVHGKKKKKKGKGKRKERGYPKKKRGDLETKIHPFEVVGRTSRPVAAEEKKKDARGGSMGGKGKKGGGWQPAPEHGRLKKPAFTHSKGGFVGKKRDFNCGRTSREEKGQKKRKNGSSRSQKRRGDGSFWGRKGGVSGGSGRHPWGTLQGKTRGKAKEGAPVKALTLTKGKQLRGMGKKKNFPEFLEGRCGTPGKKRRGRRYLREKKRSSERKKEKKAN